MDLLERCLAFEVHSHQAVFRDMAEFWAYWRTLGGVRVRGIGESRGGQDLVGLEIGTGPVPVSVVAGCHADEPMGPMAAAALPELFLEHFPELLEGFRFRIVPQMNPEGADRNRSWFANPPDFATYAQRAVREQPGDDIEYGFGGDAGARPECRAAMAFLREDGPYAAHFSLHGLPYAEGAWFLLCREWASRAGALVEAVNGLCGRLGLPLHDIDRKGEKGFFRLGAGWSTTPTSTAMQAHFVAAGEPGTASRFRPSSMEFVQSLGGDPLCLVSEVPLFLLGPGETSLEDPIFLRFKESLARAGQDRGALEALADAYALRALPLDVQIRLLCGLVVLGLPFLGRRRDGAVDAV